MTASLALLATASYAVLLITGEKKLAHSAFYDSTVSINTCPAKIVINIPSSVVIVLLLTNAITLQINNMNVKFLNSFYLYLKRNHIWPALQYRAYKILIRTRQIPVEFSRWLAIQGLPLTRNDRQLHSLHNRHRGHRAFIVATGPSLQVSDLELLKNEITFGCNKVYLAFDKTTWRPTYYSVYDLVVAENNLEAIRQLKLTKIFGSFVRPFFTDCQDITYVEDLPNICVNGNIDFQFSTDLLKGAYGGYTVVQLQLQLAYYMGIREIYLIGLDFSFSTPIITEEKSVLGEVILIGAGETNHFHPNYRKPGEKWTMPQLEMQRKAFVKSKLAFEADGGVVRNASRRTALEVFPLTEFDSLPGLQVL